ncbi:MAG: mechanosensitive ion channel family protein [Candidatus Omnitrophica bacterium]|nr:mechanosensitive ion channel family protein [Candidatus Omnitrophota bacterium]
MMSLIDHLNTLLETMVFKNTIQDYAAALLAFLALLIGLSFAKRVMVFHLGKLAARTVSDFDDFIVMLLSKIGWPVFIVVALYMAVSGLVLPETLRLLVRYAAVFVITIRSILLLQEIIQYSVNKTLLKRMGPDNPSSQAMIKSVVWLMKWVMWALGTIFILDNLGVNITSLVAGIGIGGIAVAMASQAVLGDAFSAVCIYLDKPFEIGDFIIIDDSMGSVEHIGLKTTRLRSLSGEQLVFANSDLTKSRVKNYKRMQMRRIAFKIGIVYQTPLSKAEKVMPIIRDILRIAGVQTDRVHFGSFGDSALIYEIVYYVLSADYNVYMDKQQQINFAIMREFEREGIEFAYPTQTLYMKNDHA